MAMTELPINEKNMTVLSSILRDGFTKIDDNDQPRNINQVISFLLMVGDTEGYLKPEASKLLAEYEEREQKGGLA